MRAREDEGNKAIELKFGVPRIVPQMANRGMVDKFVHGFHEIRPALLSLFCFAYQQWVCCTMEIVLHAVLFLLALMCYCCFAYYYR